MTKSHALIRFLSAPLAFTGTCFYSLAAAIAQEGERKSGLVEQSQTSIVEYLIVAVLFGLALFAICRTSHRS